ncbi:MAG: hypothetical protein K0S78_2922 [Thermomicrobiales bacterium]|jgi:hypothetical protein|nr:hypothetical protein [Thermomicrobiales bacterium]
MRRAPARIHGLLAREAPLGVVIRRGPSKQVCTVQWDRSNDDFQVGQWLRGRIYERRSDLSPDGKHLIYFAMNGKWSAESRGSWTAISRAPYLKALAFFPKGNCWLGGGLFTDNQSYWLNDGCSDSELDHTSGLNRDLEFRPFGSVGGECLSVYYPRLLRDGWRLIERVSLAKWRDFDVFEKPLDAGWVLRKIAHAEIGAPQGKGCYWDEHELIHPPSGKRISCPNWEWAELDGKRLVWAEHGRLFAGRIGEEGLRNVAQLFDFNTLSFQRIQAPY